MIHRKLTNCAKCTLKGGKKVYGDIGKKSGVLFLGEAPGKNEVLRGEVFCGRAGELLTKGLDLVDIKRRVCTIINVLLCRPPSNNNPTNLEIMCCRRRVLNTIRKVKPKVIVLLGNISFYCLFKRLPDHSERFKLLHWKKYRVVLVYHPAYFLYRNDKALFGQNFNYIKFALEGEEWKI